MTLQANPEGTCRSCQQSFIRLRPMQAVCSFKCATRTVKADKRKEAEDTRARRVALKSRRDWLNEAQKAFNAWVRARDAALPCVSCGRHHEGQYHAGHYLTVGARPELRFTPANCHKQCSACNTHLHGNLVLYRVELVKRIGLAAVEALEGPHPPAKWSADELKTIRDAYRLLAKQLTESQRETQESPPAPEPPGAESTPSPANVARRRPKQQPAECAEAPASHGPPG
jgi:hypothetical protein